MIQEAWLVVVAVVVGDRRRGMGARANETMRGI